MPQSVARTAALASAANDRSSLYEEITSKIIAELEAGSFPWVQPWGSSGVRAPLGLPRNATTGRRYSGINVLILWSAVVENGYSVQSWLTYRQALALGGHVRKGERGTTVVYADRFVPDDERQRAHERSEEPRAIPFLKRFTVFNVEQCQDLPHGIAAGAPPVDTDLILPQAEALIRAIGADLRIGGDKAYYDVAGDFIRVPPPQAFYEPINWSRTVCHEHVHWAGAAHKLNRESVGSLRLKEVCGGRAGGRGRICHALCRPRHRSNGPARRLPRRLAGRSPRGLPRDCARRVRSVEGRRLPARVPAGCRWKQESEARPARRKPGDHTWATGPTTCGTR